MAFCEWNERGSDFWGVASGTLVELASGNFSASSKSYTATVRRQFGNAVSAKTKMKVKMTTHITVPARLVAANGWYWFNSDVATHTVGQKAPNPSGLYDMEGNV
jgi:formylglycine-generating enzyme required for sulfatase activity